MCLVAMSRKFNRLGAGSLPHPSGAFEGAKSADTLAGLIVVSIDSLEHMYASVHVVLET
jgi:hypothetical protein